MTITEFLEARIAEDEETARDANEQRLWSWSQHDRMIINDSGHMQRFTPTRVLAECQAKRAILDEWARLDVDARELADPEAMTDETHTGLVWAYLDIFKHLAAVYADHPDYRDEWRTLNQP
jgi:hypothetical protein